MEGIILKFKHITYEITQNVLTITIDRESSYNSLATLTKEELNEAFKIANDDNQVRAIVLTGAGDKAFCSGQDLSESKEINEEQAGDWVGEFDTLYRTIKSVEKPLIASINGVVAGSGLQLALLCDIRIAKKSAKMGMTEIDVGLPCIIGSTMFFEVMGKNKAMDLILTGRLVKGEEALQYDLVTRLVEDQELAQETEKLAQELAAKPPVAYALNKQWFNQLSKENFNACMEFANEAHQKGYASGEPQKAMEAFFDKRNRK